MPQFDDMTLSAAPVEEVWKILYDPLRFPEWWAGFESAEEAGEPGRVTLYPTGYPDFPMAQLVEARSDQRRVVVSCQVSDLVFAWTLEPTPGDGTRIGVHVEIPEQEAFRLDQQRDAIAASLRNLAGLAAARAA